MLNNRKYCQEYILSIYLTFTYSKGNKLRNRKISPNEIIAKNEEERLV